jgi:hypothetical protein
MLVRCNLKLLGPSGPVGMDELGFLESAVVAAVTCDETGSPTRVVGGSDHDNNDSSGDDERV